MKTLSRALKTLLIAIILMLGIFIGTAAYVWTHPQETWQVLESHFLPSDLSVTWEDLQISSQHLGGLNFAVTIDLKKLRIQKYDPQLQIPLQSAQVAFSIFPFKKGDKIKLQNLSLISTEKAQFRPNRSATSKQETNPFQTLTTSLSYIKWIQKNIHIEQAYVVFQDFHLLLDNKELVLAAELKQVNDKWLLTGNGKIPQPPPLQFSFQAELPIQDLNPALPVATGVFHLHRKNLNISQEIELYSIHEEILMTSRGEVEISQVRITPSLNARWTSQMADFSLRLAVSNLPGPLKRISDIRIDIASPLEKDTLLSSKPTSFFINFPIGIAFVDQKMKSRFETSCQCKLPRLLNIEIDGETYLANIFKNSPDSKEILAADFSVNSVRNSFITLNLGAHLDILKKNEEYALKPQVRSFLVINSFSLLRRFLNQKGLLVPAPLDVLDGKMYFTVNSEIHINKDTFSLPIKGIAKLNSKNQTVDLATEIQIEFFPNLKHISINVDAAIKQLKLELPPLNPLGGKPRVLKDKRILTTNNPVTSREKAFAVSIKLNVQTSQPGSIQLLSKYFKPFLPITMHLTTNAKAIKGKIKAEPFDVEYLRRKLHVESIQVDLSDRSPQPSYPISGHFNVQQTLYTIFIDVEGTISHPLVRFRSEPYLPEDDVISVLLFDRTRSELGQMDAESSGGFQAAISDRAIGLFSLWAFASTPIRSFYYNSATKIYSATLALPNNVMASIDTDWENATQVALRKRISNQWILLATWIPATTTSPEKNKLQFLWQKRF